MTPATKKALDALALWLAGDGDSDLIDACEEWQEQGWTEAARHHFDAIEDIHDGDYAHLAERLDHVGDVPMPKGGGWRERFKPTEATRVGILLDTSGERPVLRLIGAES